MYELKNKEDSHSDIEGRLRWLPIVLITVLTYVKYNNLSMNLSLLYFSYHLSLGVHLTEP